MTQPDKKFWEELEREFQDTENFLFGSIPTEDDVVLYKIHIASERQIHSPLLEKINQGHSLYPQSREQRLNLLLAYFDLGLPLPDSDLAEIPSWYKKLGSGFIDYSQ